MRRRSERAYVLTSLADLCAVCDGRQLYIRAVDGGPAQILPRCPHCGFRFGIPYLEAPTYQDRKI
jgi:hypothetical protein